MKVKFTLKNMEMWGDGDFVCGLSQTPDDRWYWSVSSTGMITRNGHSNKRETARRCIKRAMARMTAIRNDANTPVSDADRKRGWE